MHLQSFTFNMFMENTYLLWDEAGVCAIVDPGCLFEREQMVLQDYINQHGLQPTYLLNTHCHLDHVFGNAWAERTYGLRPWIHEQEQGILQRLPATAAHWGIDGVEASPPPAGLLRAGSTFGVGSLELEVRWAPGHSPGSVLLYHAESGQALVGDVIFQQSIGRTDLPGGSHAQLIESIHKQVLSMPDATRLYPGHGPDTTVGHERVHNPFLISN
jgi:hydroxyacylglutathione hydrolase